MLELWYDGGGLENIPVKFLVNIKQKSKERISLKAGCGWFSFVQSSGAD
ncbi:hypothetical protein [Echinicola salinicaeni]|nr:hypothetical protein [Echinicola salinicaeni]